MRLLSLKTIVVWFIVLAAVTASEIAHAQNKTFVMKISLPTINDPTYVFAKNLAATLEKDSDGRIKPEVYPASQLGSIPRQIEGTQFGSIQCAMLPPEFFVGVDQRFQVLTAPGLVNSVEHANRLATDPAVQKLIYGLGADKGLQGVGLFLNGISSVIARTPIRTLADFKGKKIRTLASKFQTEPINRVGATPVVMTLGDVLPALQQGTIDGSIGSVVVFTPMKFQDAAKYVTETGQPPVFVVVEVNKKWYDTLPADLQTLVVNASKKEMSNIHPVMVELYNKARNGWTEAGGELIRLPPSDQASMMKTFAGAVADVAKANSNLNEAYQIVKQAAQRTR
jgi:TRAP-type transport system periplasmic protein